MLLRYGIGITALAFVLGGVPSAARADSITFDLAGVTQGGGPHDVIYGEFDPGSFTAGDNNLLDGLFGASGTSVRRGFAGESSGEADDGGYLNLVLSDDQYLQTADPGYGDNAFVLIEFNTGLSVLEREAIDEMFVSVEGLQGATTADWHLFVWDYTQDRYLRVGVTGTNGPDELKEDILVDGFLSQNGITLASISDLFDSEGQMTLVAANLDTSDWLRVDTVSITVQTPEPATLSLLALGVGILAWSQRRMRR